MARKLSSAALSVLNDFTVLIQRSYGLHTTVLTDSIPRKRNPWYSQRPLICNIIRKHPHLLARCDESERQAAGKGAGRCVVMKCHAGLGQMAAPACRGQGLSIQTLFSPFRPAGNSLDGMTRRLLAATGPIKQDTTPLTAESVRWLLERIPGITLTDTADLGRMATGFLGRFTRLGRAELADGQSSNFQLPVRSGSEQSHWLSYLWGGWGHSSIEPPGGGWRVLEGTDTLLYARDASLEVITGKRRVELGIGALTIIPPGIRHRVLSRAGKFPYAYWMVFVSSLDLDPLYLTPVKPRGNLLVMLESLVRFTTTENVYPYDATKKLRTLNLLEGLLASVRRRARGKPVPAPHPVSSRVELVRHLLESTIDRKVPLAEMGKVAGLSPFTLCRRFAVEVGESPAAFHRRIRIEEACRLLATQDSSVRSIAIRVGFPDQAHFCRVFKKTTGVAPREFVREKGMGP